MLTNLQNKDLKTEGFVLRRTNYGEADRILNIITPVGKISAMARGVRKEKSKLAGGVEMLTRSNYVIHFGKSEIGVVTSVKMVRYFGELLKDYDTMELVGMILKKINWAADSVDNAEYFSIVEQCLEALEAKAKHELVEAWFVLNLRRAMGEQMNLYRDAEGAKLSAEEYYAWDGTERALRVHKTGEYGVNEIKLMRLMLAMNLGAIQRVKVDEATMRKVCGLCKISNANML
ncbi:DNA repair protein RecO [Candidatus Saccharibacteria bacterium]|nr:DNA repair protein RecO [Candidatus Saccharibacteria bacterium]